MMHFPLQILLFYIFSAITIFAAIKVVLSKSPVHAVLFLILAFVASAGNWLLLEAEFLSFSLIIVYVGAVMVLFLFVVMMLDVGIKLPTLLNSTQILFALFLFALIVGMMSWVLGAKYFGLEFYALPTPKSHNFSNIAVLGQELFTKHLYAFEVAGAILLSSMIAAITLTFRGYGKRKLQNVGKQVGVTKADRLSIIKD